MTIIKHLLERVRERRNIRRLRDYLDMIPPQDRRPW